MLCIIIMWHKIISNEEQSSNRERCRSLLMRLDDYKELDIIWSSTVVDLQLINLFSYEYEWWFRLALGCCIPCSPSPARLVAIDGRGFQYEGPSAPHRCGRL